MSNPLVELHTEWVETSEDHRLIIWKQCKKRTTLILYASGSWDYSANRRRNPVKKRFTANHSKHGTFTYLILAERALDWIADHQELLAPQPLGAGGFDMVSNGVGGLFSD